MFHETNDIVIPAGFHLYQRTGTDDAIMVQLYSEMLNDGSLKYLFYDTTISGMFRALDPTRTVTLLRLKDGGVPWLAAWFEPCFDGAYLGLWSTDARRRTKAGFDSLCTLIDVGLQHRPVVIGTTRAELVDQHKRFGYTELGGIPALWDGRAVHWVYVTRPMFEASPAGHRWRRYKKASV